MEWTSGPYERTVPCGRTERTKRDGSNPWQIGPMSDWSARAGSKTRRDWPTFSDTRDYCRGGKRVSPCPVHHPSCPVYRNFPQRILGSATRYVPSTFSPPACEASCQIIDTWYRMTSVSHAWSSGRPWGCIRSRPV